MSRSLLCLSLVNEVNELLTDWLTRSTNNTVATYSGFFKYFNEQWCMEHIHTLLLIVQRCHRFKHKQLMKCEHILFRDQKSINNCLCDAAGWAFISSLLNINAIISSSLDSHIYWQVCLFCITITWSRVQSCCKTAWCASSYHSLESAKDLW